MKSRHFMPVILGLLLATAPLSAQAAGPTIPIVQPGQDSFTVPYTSVGPAQLQVEAESDTLNIIYDGSLYSDTALTMGAQSNGRQLPDAPVPKFGPGGFRVS